MLNRLKRLHNPLSPLEYIWLSTPRPGYDGEWGKRAAALARPGYKIKADAAVQALATNRALEKSWLGKKIDAALEPELAWRGMALADTIRWGFCCGLEAADIQSLARKIPAVPSSVEDQKLLVSELATLFIHEKEDPGTALSLVLHLHAVLAPSFDVTTPEQIAQIVANHGAHKLSLSAATTVLFTGIGVGLPFLLRAGLAAFAAMVPSHWGARSAVAALVFSAGRFLTKGVTVRLLQGIGRLYALLVVRAEVQGIAGLEPISGLRRPGYALPTAPAATNASTNVDKARK